MQKKCSMSCSATIKPKGLYSVQQRAKNCKLTPPCLSGESQSAHKCFLARNYSAPGQKIPCHNGRPLYKIHGQTPFYFYLIMLKVAVKLRNFFKLCFLASIICFNTKKHPFKMGVFLSYRGWTKSFMAVLSSPSIIISVKAGIQIKSIPLGAKPRAIATALIAWFKARLQLLVFRLRLFRVKRPMLLLQN